MDEPIETLEILGGNTKIPPKSQPSQLLHWFFTWNNYTSKDIEILETIFKQFCFKYCFQEETGEQGTPHLQGVISLKKRMRWSEFGLPRDIHWEKVKHVTKSYEYCSKTETRTGKVFTFNYELPYSLNLSLYDWQVSITKIIDKKANNRTIHWVWEPSGCRGKTTFQKWIYTRYADCVVLSGKGSERSF